MSTDTSKMTREELQAELRQIQEEHLATIVAAHPEVDMERAHVRYMGGEVTVYPEGGLVALLCSGGRVLTIPTDLGYRLHSDRGPRVVHDDGYRVWIIQELWAGADTAWVNAYSRTTGGRAKGLKLRRAIHRSARGRYIDLGRRVYLTFPEAQEETEEGAR